MSSLVAQPARYLLLEPGAIVCEQGTYRLFEARQIARHRRHEAIGGLPSGALRLGWAFAPAHIIDVMNRVRSPFNVNTPAMMAGIAALHDQAYIAETRAKNKAERERISSAITAMGYEVVPSHTNFVLVKFGAQASAVNAHLASQGIMVREVAAYGLADYLRISIGTAEENTEMLAALKSFSGAKAA